MKCEQCEVEFVPRTGTQRFCSYVCKRKARRLRKRQVKDKAYTCEQCKGVFYLSSDAGMKQRFCSTKCATASQTRSREIKICDRCWESFIPRFTAQTYCCVKDKHEKVCQRCQKPFKVKCDKYLARRRYCSKNCVPAPYTWSDCWVYFILAEKCNRVKIGIASDVDERFSTLFRENADDLKLLKAIPGGLELEQEIHRELELFRAHNEWFEWTPEVQETVNRYIKDPQ
jgi:hypothetical protein